ncbi:hypothetical protein D7V86_06010 [bacterium D16-51]|nr:hypothetical protein D7V96_06665 [bacterium D16-59]RKI61333.1 hypothetical protein D7V86_06010 [bacterium D16-51]
MRVADAQKRASFLQKNFGVAISENGALAVAGILSEKCKIGIFSLFSSVKIIFDNDKPLFVYSWTVLVIEIYVELW